MKKTWSKVLATVLVLAMVLCMPGFAASVDTVDYDADHAASADELTDADLPELLSALPVLADRITARLRSFCAGCPEGLQQWVTQLLERLEQTASEALGSLSSALLMLERAAAY